MPINYGEYPKDWPEIRCRILHRAGERRDEKGRIVVEGRCEWCGADNHRTHPETGSMVVLTIAHLDHDKENEQVKDERLAALCQRCHLGYDREHHIKRRRENRHNAKGQLPLYGNESGSGI